MFFNIPKMSYRLRTSSPFVENVSLSKYLTINFFRAVVKIRSTYVHWTGKNIPVFSATPEAIAILHRKKYNSPLEDKLKLWKAAIHEGRGVKRTYCVRLSPQATILGQCLWNVRINAGPWCALRLFCCQ